MKDLLAQRKSLQCFVRLHFRLAIYERDWCRCSTLSSRKRSCKVYCHFGCCLCHRITNKNNKRSKTKTISCIVKKRCSLCICPCAGSLFILAKPRRFSPSPTKRNTTFQLLRKNENELYAEPTIPAALYVEERVRLIDGRRRSGPGTINNFSTRLFTPSELPMPYLTVGDREHRHVHLPCSFSPSCRGSAYRVYCIGLAP